MTDLEDLLVRTLRDPARALPAPADAMAGVRSRARAQRRTAALAVVAAVLAVAALVVPAAALRTDRALPPAAPAPLLDWAPRGELVGDTALIADAERAWRGVGGSSAPVGPLSVLWAGSVGGRATVLLQGRNGAGPVLAQTSSEGPTKDPATPGGGRQLLVRADRLDDPGIPAVLLTTDLETVLVVRPGAETVVVLGDRPATSFTGVIDGVVNAAEGIVGKGIAVLDDQERVLADGTVSSRGALPVARNPVLRIAAPTWAAAGPAPEGRTYADGAALADLAGASGGAPLEVAALSGGSSIEVGGRMVEPRLYELRRSGRTWLASGVVVPGTADLQCPRAAEVTGRVGEVHAYLSRCRLPELSGGLLHLVLADGVRATRVSVAAAGAGQLAVDSRQPLDGGLVQVFGTNLPTGPGRVTLVDAAGKELPPLVVPAYS